MKIFLLIVLFVSIFLILHTYILYPLFCFVLSRLKSEKFDVYSREDELPFVSIIMPLHNEEKVLEQKIESLLKLNYPIEKIRWFAGSDASTDRTNEILSRWKDQHEIYFMNNRTGKPGMVNFLVEKAVNFKPAGPGHILLFTDASVILEPDCLFNLVKYFKDKKMGLVDANMRNVGITSENISAAESKYVSLEVILKHWESRLNRKMIGPFGGCFALRSDYFTPVPDNLLVDDFFLCMEVFRKNGNAINSLEAVSYESVSQEIHEEFRRKVRIGAGNLQNLTYFDWFLRKPLIRTAFYIYSHKVIRWFVPVFSILSVIALVGLSIIEPSRYFFILLTLLSFVIGIPLMEYIFSGLKIVVLPVKSLNYFIWMNLALLKGIFNYFKGIKTNVWQPTKRY